MKKLVFVMVLLLLLAVPAFAAGSLLVDGAQLLTAGEEAELQQELEQLRDEIGMDVVIVTCNGTDGRHIRDYADDYYDYNGYSANGVLLLIDMDSRRWWISGTGQGAAIFTNAVIDDVGAEFEDALSDGEYATAFEIYIEECACRIRYNDPYSTDDYYSDDGYYSTDDYYSHTDYDDDGQIGVGTSLAVAAVIGLVAALIATAVMRGQLKSVHSKASAADYVKPGSMVVSNACELYLYSNVTKIRRQQNSSGGTHRSSSGRSHSGGGGRF